MNYFPNGDEEISLIKFVAKFQYLYANDSKYFFKTKDYYRKRIISLVDKKYLRRINVNLVLGELGIEYVKSFHYEYNVLNRNKKYLPRLLYISNLGAYFFACKTITFIPSFDIKDKEILTTTARKFVGIFNISGIDYLTYYISGEHTKQYLSSVIYDIQKERNYSNILVLVNDLTRIDVSDFAFGLNQVLVAEDNEYNREKLKYTHNINWHKVIEDYYKNKVYLAEYRFCDYTDYQNKYVSTFYFLDTEKINRIKQFLRENKNKNADIICSSELKNEIQKEIPNANYITIDLEKYIDKERRFYE